MTLRFSEFLDADSIPVAAFLHRPTTIGGLVGRVVVRATADRVEAWTIVRAELFPEPISTLRLTGSEGQHGDWGAQDEVHLRNLRT